VKFCQVVADFCWVNVQWEEVESGEYMWQSEEGWGKRTCFFIVSFIFHFSNVVVCFSKKKFNRKISKFSLERPKSNRIFFLIRKFC